ncbi:MAG: cyclic pyranopterin monophosphate synthase MoaC [Candidatus Riflebacteria bacterium]|nr:cyclic pyranopterin monophosphate synthase MoaC [Candidatus Riflebacteria bacterium]
MVDVGNKDITSRTATAFGIARVGHETLSRLVDNNIPKGDAFAAARIAGIMGAKKTSELIPLTHPLGLDLVKVFVAPWGEEQIAVFAEARTRGRTGVEMEAMTAVSVALLTLYDMLKAVTKGIVMENVRLLRKTGGKSGEWLGKGVQVAHVEKLAISPGKGTPKNPLDMAKLRIKHGLEGDAHAADWHRQVSLLGVESIAKMKAKGLDVNFGSFAENIATSGVDLYKLPIGSLMIGGDGVILEVTQIGKECHTRCAVYYQAGDCVMPREGIFARVLAGGQLMSGDSLLIIEKFSAPESL